MLNGTRNSFITVILRLPNQSLHVLYQTVCLFVLRFKIPINIFSVMSGRINQTMSIHFINQSFI